MPQVFAAIPLLLQSVAAAGTALAGAVGLSGLQLVGIGLTPGGGHTTVLRRRA